MVAIALRTRADRSEVGTGTWLRKALAPHLFARDDLRQETLLLFWRSVLEKCRTCKVATDDVDAFRSSRTGQLFGIDGLFNLRSVAPAEFDGPVNAGPAAAIKRLFPFDAELGTSVLILRFEHSLSPAVGQGIGKPGTQV